ncbi:low temperature requirement protein LtrA [Kribbella sp. VKM Ac-2571]|uniref:low temperature requirement protein A n=1 Tax=Kribbella sp. VKM Ac-2571 TaxID=2512222 RepID=UPI0010CE4E3F|nr:low temperature requirement protein A [Kribbella sp. VKM Ac-2571]TDO58958.1 low temperature requirement protein LtrA [Kribbella sp. VKM Ac-2571]
MPEATVRIRVRMTARPIDEPHRASSNLELLFDLTFVVAVAAVTEQFAHTIADGHAAVLPFLQVFFAIWWAWMNFTWFASSYDTDDVTYRILTMVQMAGVLLLAAGVPAAADHGDYLMVTSGYLVMRLGLISLWLRAGIEDPASRRTAFRYAIGIGALQLGWFGRLYLAEAGASAGGLLVAFIALAILELSVPLWAERPRATSWHPHHIAERYGLFTIILLGEAVLAASNAVRRAVEETDVNAELIAVAGCGLVILFALWWLYFLHPAGPRLEDRRDRSYRWGYGHYGLFAALAALGAGLEVAVEQTSHTLHLSPTGASYAVAVPAASFIALLWGVHRSIADGSRVHLGTALAGIVVLLLLPLATPAIGPLADLALMAATCVAVVAVASRDARQ